MASSDTIFALSSGRPPAAVAIVRTSGPRAFAAAETLCGRLPPARTASLRSLRDSEGTLIDDALVLRFDGPASATGENVVEYQCHGGRAVVDALLAALAGQPGMREAEPGEFTRRAFANGRIDLTEAEGLADLLEAETESQRRAALLMAEGGLKAQIDGWRKRVIELSARAEAAIDYVGDEEETTADEAALGASMTALESELREWLERPRAEPLKEGIRVVVAGPPNAGKSSLVNALSRSDRAIVTEIAGTTRDIIEVPTAIDGVPFVLVDTAGLRHSEDKVESIGVERAHGQVSRADIVLWLGEPEQAPLSSLVVRSKADLVGASPAPRADIVVSAVTGSGMDTLVQLICDRARDLLPVEGQVALNRRQAKELEAARNSLADSASVDLVRMAEGLRSARAALDRITGRAGLEEMLDALFGRFCLGK